MGTKRTAPPRPGMYDVARVAGVSHQTVSRVINSHPNVSAPTRERVLKAIADLGYRRNTAARALVRRRSETIGVVTMGTTLFGPTSALLSVEIAARSAGYFVSLASLARADQAEAEATFEHFLAQAVEAVVVIAPNAAVMDAVRAFRSAVPMVLLAAAPKSAAFSSVSVNQRLGAQLAVRHLVEVGHTDIAHLAGPKDFFDGLVRAQGWREELRTHGLKPGAFAMGDWSAHSGYQVGKRMIARRVPGAFFAGNDLMALGLVRALTEAGYAVPGDVSVVGFDDLEGSEFFTPPLTTVRQDFTYLGEQCIAILRQLLDGMPVPAWTPIPPELIVRASTRKPR